MTPQVCYLILKRARHFSVGQSILLAFDFTLKLLSKHLEQYAWQIQVWWWFLGKVLNESGFYIYISHVRFHDYSFKELLAVKRKLLENKESDFIVVKKIEEILKDTLSVSYIIWKRDIKEIGFLLKFAFKCTKAK